MIRVLRKLSRFLPDTVYTRLKFKKNARYWPNLKMPKTFNEKLQWLKLRDRDPVFTDMVDKYAVKRIVADRIGEQYIVPAYGVWDEFDHIDFNNLPNKFVLKTTHDCGGVVLCTDKSSFDFSKARRFLEQHKKINYFYQAREWPYKNVRPRILAEAFIGEENSRLVVYKVLCFHGEPRIIQVIQNDKTPDESIDYFDTQWKLMDLRQNYPNSKVHMTRPQVLEEMLLLSRELAGERPFMRVDWYEVEGKLLFSEFTFYSDAGCAAFHPSKWDEELGGWIHLPCDERKR